MKILYIECSMGVAGDMLMGALYELLNDEDRKKFTDKMNSLGIEGLHIEAVPSVKCGINGTHMNVTIDGIFINAGFANVTGVVGDGLPFVEYGSIVH